jgi:CRISPR/Cas system CMR subunit Cmr4 (Cas7 group RAMP superfamily)
LGRVLFEVGGREEEEEEEEEGRSLFVDTVILVFPTRDSFVCIL